MINLLAAILSGWVVFLVYRYHLYRLKLQDHRIRVLTAFISGLFERTVKISEIINGPNGNVKISKLTLFRESPEYEWVMSSIRNYFEDACSAESFKKFLLSQSKLFHDKKMGDGGFLGIYDEFFAGLTKETLSEGSNLFSDQEKEFLKRIVQRNAEWKSKASANLNETAYAQTTEPKKDAGQCGEK